MRSHLLYTPQASGVCMRPGDPLHCVRVLRKACYDMAADADHVQDICVLRGQTCDGHEICQR